MSRQQFLERWRAHLAELARFHAFVNGEKLITELLGDFESFIAEEDEKLVDLQDASRLSGYSKDHLRRLGRIGRLKIERRGRRLLFRTGDLPRKPPVDQSKQGLYDPVADARRVVTRRNLGGAHG